MNLDRFELEANLNLFSVIVNEGDQTEKLRNCLKKVVLEEILKAPGLANKSIYSNCLKSVIDDLFQESSGKGYSCFLVGCRFKAERHRNQKVSSKFERHCL